MENNAIEATLQPEEEQVSSILDMFRLQPINPPYHASVSSRHSQLPPLHAPRPP